MDPLAQPGPPDPAAVAAVNAEGHLHLVIPGTEGGARLDRLLGRLLAPAWSRSYLAALIEQGTITVDGAPVRVSYRVNPGQLVEGEILQAAESLPSPGPMDLDLVHVDDSLIVVNKPAGLVVHPGTGARTGTLVNGLLHHFPELAAVGRADRPGIVHRLDRETTGVMVVARTNDAARSLVDQFKRKVVTKEYTAVVWGEMPFDNDWIDLPLGGHPHHAALRAVVREGGQPASTFYSVERRLGHFTVVTAQPRTGRTHQIRVHLEHVGYPVVRDPAYGRDAQAAYGSWLAKRRRLELRLPILNRQALHARRITLQHPATGEMASFEAPLPQDMADLIEIAESEAVTP
ncbi:MAG: RluA family pseudouridine synthase [Planctomycetota bacterium]